MNSEAMREIYPKPSYLRGGPNECLMLSGNRVGLVMTGGYVAVIDAADYPLVSAWRWHTKKRDNTQYASTSVVTEGGKRHFRIHNVLMGARTGHEIDHIDGNGLNNSRSNLRFATRAQNAQNRPALLIEGRRSKFKGVYGNYKYWKSGIGNRPYQAATHYNGKKIPLGYFYYEMEAAMAYDAAASLYHGEFANLNFPTNIVTNITNGGRHV